MDKIFRFDEQEFVSKPVVLRKFFEDALRERDSMQFFGAYMGEKNAWRSKFIPWLRSMNLVDDSALIDIRLLVHKVARSCRHPTKQYCYDKDGGRSYSQLDKRTRFRSVNILQELNAKRKNPQYKSISLRSMLYDKYDPYVFVQRAHQYSLTALSTHQLSFYNPYEDMCCQPSNDINSFRKAEDVPNQSNGFYVGSSISNANSVENLQPGWSLCNEIDDFFSYTTVPCQNSFTVLGNTCEPQNNPSTIIAPMAQHVSPLPRNGIEGQEFAAVQDYSFKSEKVDLKVEDCFAVEGASFAASAPPFVRKVENEVVIIKQEEPEACKFFLSYGNI
ncbi:unnamed protein product [Strongylus vulgaris]|uniref:Uncharacterized protein n=1 Tax=Strongylus vulgaris TaxID=40348 RepID=A0A3P7J4A1_STRVU|nr:unnamed protein product [Strongylus vulgaris]